MCISFEVCLWNAIARALHDYSNAVDIEDAVMEEVPRDLARTIRTCSRRYGRMNWHKPNGEQAGSGNNSSPDSHSVTKAEMVEHSLYEEGTH